MVNALEDPNKQDDAGKVNNLDNVLGNKYESLLKVLGERFGDLVAIAKGSGENSEPIMKEISEVLKSAFKDAIENGAVKTATMEVMESQASQRKIIKYRIEDLVSSKLEIKFRHDNLDDLLSEDQVSDSNMKKNDDLLEKMLGVPMLVSFKGGDRQGVVNSFILELPQIKDLNPDAVSTFEKGSKSKIEVYDYYVGNSAMKGPNFIIDTANMKADEKHAKYLEEIQKNFAI